jgi:DeoR family fructose operon transcriptional repressor
MEKSFPLERKDQILDLITRKGRITVDELIERFKVSGATIRRDLEFLERQGLITRAHGGAMSKSRVSLEPDFFEEKEKFLEEKERIGDEANKLVEEDEVIFLEASTSVLQLARNLKNRRSILIKNLF